MPKLGLGNIFGRRGGEQQMPVEAQQEMPRYERVELGDDTDVVAGKCSNYAARMKYIQSVEGTPKAMPEQTVNSTMYKLVLAKALLRRLSVEPDVAQRAFRLAQGDNFDTESFKNAAGVMGKHAKGETEGLANFSPPTPLDVVKGSAMMGTLQAEASEVIVFREPRGTTFGEMEEGFPPEPLGDDTSLNQTWYRYFEALCGGNVLGKEVDVDAIEDVFKLVERDAFDPKLFGITVDMARQAAETGKYVDHTKLREYLDRLDQQER